MVVDIASIIDAYITLAFKEGVDMDARGCWLSRESPKKIDKFLLH